MDIFSQKEQTVVYLETQPIMDYLEYFIGI